MDVVAMFSMFGVGTLAIAAATFVVMRFARVRVDTELALLEPGFRAEEATTGRCAACRGAGTRMEITAGRSSAGEREVTCFRCHGTGRPPTTC